MRPTITAEELDKSLDAYEKWVAGIDEEVARRKQDLAGRGELTTCRVGCVHCCKLSVTVGAADALRLARRLFEELRVDEDIKKRLYLAARAHDQARDAGEYYSRLLPCVFLAPLAGKCNVYADRPVVCRLMWSVSAVTACEKMGQLRMVNTADLKHGMRVKNEQFAALTWAPLNGSLPGMVLWAIEMLENMRRRNYDGRDDDSDGGGAGAFRLVRGGVDGGGVAPDGPEHGSDADVGVADISRVRVEPEGDGATASSDGR